MPAFPLRELPRSISSPLQLLTDHRIYVIDTTQNLTSLANYNSFEEHRAYYPITRPLQIQCLNLNNTIQRGSRYIVWTDGSKSQEGTRAAVFYNLDHPHNITLSHPAVQNTQQAEALAVLIAISQAPEGTKILIILDSKSTLQAMLNSAPHNNLVRAALNAACHCSINIKLKYVPSHIKAKLNHKPEKWTATIQDLRNLYGQWFEIFRWGNKKVDKMTHNTPQHINCLLPSASRYAIALNNNNSPSWSTHSAKTLLEALFPTNPVTNKEPSRHLSLHLFNTEASAFCLHTTRLSAYAWNAFAMARANCMGPHNVISPNKDCPHRCNTSFTLEHLITQCTSTELPCNKLWRDIHGCRGDTRIIRQWLQGPEPMYMKLIGYIPKGLSHMARNPWIRLP